MTKQIHISPNFGCGFKTWVYFSLVIKDFGRQFWDIPITRFYFH